MNGRTHGVLAAALFCAAAARGVTPVEPPWERPAGFPAESELLSDRLEEAQSHFLVDGVHAFVAGRDFYEAAGDLNPFLWPSHPFARLWPDRDWLDDSSDVAFALRGGGPSTRALPGGAPAFSSVEAAWQALSELRLRAAFDANDLYADRQADARRARAEDPSGQAWLGDGFPAQTRAGAGAMWSHRGADIALQYDQGNWWTFSPASGMAYPWKGFNADFLYRMGRDVDISLRDQEWDAAEGPAFLAARWRRSDLNMGFTSEGPGGWVTRLELGYQRRALFSDSAFEPFEERTYPVRFRYLEAWSPVDSTFKLLTRGSIGYREQMFSVEHAEEFSETFGRHALSQFLRGYYREPVGHRPVPTEYFPGDSVGARVEPGENARGAAAGAEYRFHGARMTLGAACDGGLEWALPVFRLQGLDTVDGLLRRTGAYTGSDYALANGSVRAFVSGAAGKRGTWRLHGGARAFFGHDAEVMEFLPSPWWAGGETGWKLPFGLRALANATWLGPKEVRGWGDVFRVRAHWEGNVALEQAVGDRLKVSASFLQIFADDVREHPNGSPVGFRTMLRTEGSF